MLRSVAPGLLNVTAVTPPAVLTLRDQRSLGDLPAPAPTDNLVEDARPALDRLHDLWAIADDEHQAALALWAPLAEGTQLTGQNLVPLTKAIRKALEPSLRNEVSNHYLPTRLPDGGSVGAGNPYDPKDLEAVQNALCALRLMTPSEVTSNDWGATLNAIRELKRGIAAATLGWEPMRADEDEAGGDRFCGRTYGPFPGQGVDALFSVFVPRAAPPDANFVHVFFSPDEVWGDNGGNGVLHHGLRAAFEDSKWILVGVAGKEPGRHTISMSEIEGLLQQIRRTSTNVSGLRLSAHSRGHRGVAGTVTETDKSTGKRLIDPALVDRVTVFDASYHTLGDALRASGLASRARLYDATVANVSGIGGIRLPHLAGLQAVGYVRHMEDAMNRGRLRPPPDKLALANLLLQGSPAWPARGKFTAAGLTTFCQAHEADIKKICDPSTGLRDYILKTDLPRWRGTYLPDAIGEQHHYFVCELVHEAVGP